MKVKKKKPMCKPMGQPVSPQPGISENNFLESLLDLLSLMQKKSWIEQTRQKSISVIKSINFLPDHPFLLKIKFFFNFDIG